MNWSLLLMSVVPVCVGAAIGVIPALLLERRRERGSGRARLAEALLDSSAELTAASRRLCHLADLANAHGLPDDGLAALDAEQQQLRVALERLLLVGDENVQRTGRRVVHHSWAYKDALVAGADPHPGDPRRPGERLHSARHAFYRAVRRQLGVPRPTQLALGLSQSPETRSELDGS